MANKPSKPGKSIPPEQCVALIFPNLNIKSSKDFTQSLSNHLNQHNIDSLILPAQEIQENITQFKKLETDDALMGRLANVVAQTLSQVSSTKRRHIIFIGVSAGARFMSAYALAHKLGLTPETKSFMVHGFVGFNISTSLRLSKPTPKEIKELRNINQMDYNTNISYQTDSLIYDVYVDRDSASSETSGARAERYQKQGLHYKQKCLQSCDYTSDNYYEKKNGEFYLYTEVSAHTLQNGYLMRDDGSFDLVHRLHGTNDAPAESVLDQYLVDTGTLKLQ